MVVRLIPQLYKTGVAASSEYLHHLLTLKSTKRKRKGFPFHEPACVQVVAPAGHQQVKLTFTIIKPHCCLHRSHFGWTGLLKILTDDLEGGPS